MRACMQVPGTLRAALHEHSSTVLVLGIAKALAARLLPDATRTVRMWRMFLPIWARCKWLKWRCREDRGYTKQQARSASSPWQCMRLARPEIPGQGLCAPAAHTPGRGAGGLHAN